jgi:chemotaxis protein MotA
MDFATLIGIVLAVSAIGGSYYIEGGTIESIFLLAPMVIVFGGTIGATVITTSMQTVRRVPNFLHLAFFAHEYDAYETIDTIVRLAEKARKEGILGLESNLKTTTDPFLRKGLQLVIDGTEIHDLKEILETEIANSESRHRKGIIFFQKAGGFAPTMGILGTVLGLINTLSNTSDAALMAQAIAGAFIATLWGVGIANIFFLPIADKLRLRHDDEVAHSELILEGIMAIQTGDNPRNIRMRLLSFVHPTMHRASDRRA